MVHGFVLCGRTASKFPSVSIPFHSQRLDIHRGKHSANDHGRFQGRLTQAIGIEGDRFLFEYVQRSPSSEEDLHREAKTPLDIQQQKENGETSFTGMRNALTASSSYTRAMGLSMAMSFAGFPANEIVSTLSKTGN